MTRTEKFLFKLLRGLSDNDIRFEELRNFLLTLGFDERVKGSHHLFRKTGIEQKINIQKDGDKAKAYQVKQVRQIILKYKLGSSQ